jgi:hypothetical protein
MCIKKVMKKLLLYTGLGVFHVACNDEKKYSNEEAEKRDYNMGEKQKQRPRIATDNTTNT